MTSFLKGMSLLALALLATAGFAQKGKGKSAPAPVPSSTVTPIKLSVDATHAPEKILHSTLQIPVHPGPLTMVYPKWIPGEHGPTGPIADLTGLQFYAKGQRLTWRRKLDDMYAFDLTIP